MRKTKRELLAADSTGDKDRFTEKSVLLRRQREEYGKFSKAAGLLAQNERTQVGGFGHSQASKAAWAAPNGLTSNANSGTINAGRVIANVTCGSPMSIDEALKANPNYSSGREYQINCQRCVQAYELRRRGYDVIAKPKPASNNLVSWGNECFIPSSANPHNEYIFSNAVSEVKKELTAAPDGSRYSVYIAWKGRSGGAHVFIAEKQGNTIRYVDPQTGNSDVSSYFLRGKRFGLFRLDDKDIEATDDIINQTVENPSP